MSAPASAANVGVPAVRASQTSRVVGDREDGGEEDAVIGGVWSIGNYLFVGATVMSEDRSFIDVLSIEPTPDRQEVYPLDYASDEDVTEFTPPAKMSLASGDFDPEEQEKARSSAWHRPLHFNHLQRLPIKQWGFAGAMTGSRCCVYMNFFHKTGGGVKVQSVLRFPFGRQMLLGDPSVVVTARGISSFAVNHQDTEMRLVDASDKAAVVQLAIPPRDDPDPETYNLMDDEDPEGVRRLQRGGLYVEEQWVWAEGGLWWTMQRQAPSMQNSQGGVWTIPDPFLHVFEEDTVGKEERFAHVQGGLFFGRLWLRDAAPIEQASVESKKAFKKNQALSSIHVFEVRGPKLCTLELPSHKHVPITMCVVSFYGSRLAFVVSHKKMDRKWRIHAFELPPSPVDPRDVPPSLALPAGLPIPQPPVAPPVPSGLVRDHIPEQNLTQANCRAVAQDFAHARIVTTRIVYPGDEFLFAYGRAFRTDVPSTISGPHQATAVQQALLSQRGHAYRTSKIPYAGKGLFYVGEEPLVVGTEVAKYQGVNYPKDVGISQEQKAAGYILETSREGWIDAQRRDQDWGWAINSPVRGQPKRKHEQ